MKKVGIFGGTFSPPHNGHTAAAAAFSLELGLDRLYVIPANIPPHKTIEYNNPAERLEMTKLAFSSVPSAVVSDYELSVPGKSYTSDTLEHFYGDESELYLYCGTDMFNTLASWHKPETICSLATIVLGQRDNDSESNRETLIAENQLKERFGARIIRLSAQPFVISSTEIRRRVKSGLEIADYVCPGVRDYIEKKGLYLS